MASIFSNGCALVRLPSAGGQLIAPTGGAFRKKKIYRTIYQLQADLDAWLAEYYERRPYQGRWCFGRPDADFLRTAPWQRRKLMAAARPSDSSATSAQAEVQTEAPDHRTACAATILRIATIMPDVRHRTSRHLNNKKCRKFPSADPKARTANAAIQVVCSDAAIPLGARHDLRSLPATSTSHDGRRFIVALARTPPGSGTQETCARVSGDRSNWTLGDNGNWTL
jgi:hypothetical protein